MENLGERLVGDYLRHVKGCDFVDFNVYTKTAQGEIDVIGVNLAEKKAFVCEVATHLTTGLQYTRNARPDTARRLIAKFLKDIEYGSSAFAGYTVVYMLWSPVVRRSGGKQEYNQFAHLDQIRNEVKKRAKVDLVFIVNEDYVSAVEELRRVARRETKELKSPVMRFLQIDEWSRKNVKRASNKASHGEVLSRRP
jgi:Holliday junction resolvase-like predicted endonuclease